VLEGLHFEHTLCDGEVGIRSCYPKLAARFPDAPPDHPHIARADEYLHRWPLGLALVKALVHSFHPFRHPEVSLDESARPTTSFCHSSDLPEEFGAICSTINDPLCLAENLIHEAAHQKLFALGIRKTSSEGLIANVPEERFRSPVRKDEPRPMTALVHGVYAYMYVTALDLALLRDEPPGTFREVLLNRLATNLKRLLEGAGEMKAHREVDVRGACFFTGFDGWLDELIEAGTRLTSASPVTTDRPRTASRGASAREPVRVFVGTDARQHRAELALEYSIRKHTTGPVEIVWMDHRRGGLWGAWDIGRQRGRVRIEPGPGWATEFTCFRFALPEAAGFRGRAIYLDSDMLVVGDLRELFERDMPKPWLKTANCPATMLIDCAYFEDKSWWPRIEKMKRSGWGLGDYLNLLATHGVVADISERWNCHDGQGFVPGQTAVIHFTHRATQPWMPYPEVFNYGPHPDPEMEARWWELYLEARRAVGMPSPMSSPAKD
jgi:hypothetical protein